MNPLTRLLVACVLLSVLTAPAFAQDPVTDFIVQADAAAQSGGDTALSKYISENGILVGAAVAQLLDVSFQIAQQGNAEGEKENVDFAERVAIIYKQESGSSVPLELVSTYRSWTPAQRQQRGRAMQLEEEGKAARGAGELEKSAELYSQARAIYEKIGDRHSVAINWGSMGVTHWYTGDWDMVIADYENALEARRAVEDRILEGKTLNGLGSAYQQKGDWDQSESYYQQAIELRRRTGDMGGLGTSLTYLGNTYYLSGRLVDARDQYEAALPILEQQGQPEQMVDMLSAIAQMYTDMGRIGSANDTYRRAIELSMSDELPGREIVMRINYADNLTSLARYSEAMEQFAMVEPLFELANVWRPLFHQARGRLLLITGDSDGARADFLEAAKLAQESGDPLAVAQARELIGLLYKEMGEYERALAAFEESRDLAIEAQNGRQYRSALHGIANTQLALGRPDEALANFEEAQSQDEADGVANMVLMDRINVAAAKANLGRLDEARAELYGVLSDPLARGNAEVRWTVHLGLGETFEASEPDSAAWHYERAMEEIESTRASLGADEAATGFLSGDRRFYYEEIAYFYADADRVDDAFHTMERARARRLLDRMNMAMMVHSSQEEEALLDEMGRATDEETRRAAEAKLEALRDARQARAIGALADTRVATIASLQDVLDKKTVVLAYALGDSASMLFVVDRKNAELHELPPRRDLAGPVERLRDALRQPGAGDEALRENATHLYATLVAPARERLKKADRVLIIPDGFLFEVPFEAMIAGEGTPDWTETEWFGREYATLYAPSASVYVAMRGGEKRKYEMDLVAFGAPDYTTLGDAGARLSPLPYAEQEVAAISERIDDDRKIVRTGTGATESALRADVSNGNAPRVVHLATHGLVDAAEPDRSSVVLARAPESDDDGFYRAGDIAGSDIEAGLVVLSACETATGRVTRGEGVIGLTQAFIASGAEGVVASLWPVSDESTAELMQAFYERMLGKKKGAAEAMQYARAKLLEDPERAHPFYWSPFIVMGSERTPW